jgi:hypothetical protein
MILYIPHYMQSSQITHILNKDFFLYKTFSQTTTFANKQFHAKIQPTRGWMLEEYA